MRKVFKIAILVALIIVLAVAATFFTFSLFQHG